MTQEEARRLELGVYELFWKTGRVSLASVGDFGTGNRWFASADWSKGTDNSIVSADWEDIERVYPLKLQPKVQRIAIGSRFVKITTYNGEVSVSLDFNYQDGTLALKAKGIEAMIVSLIKSGIDITEPKYIKVICEAVKAISAPEKQRSEPDDFPDDFYKFH